MATIMTRSTLAAATALALALAACSKGKGDDDNSSDMAPPALPATLPMATGPATTQALAPSATALAPRRIATAEVADPRDRYAYADQAADYAGALEDGPPDYGFDYDGVEPWAWQDANGYRMFAEPIDDGYRYYYYRPGADTPYFVRDPDYGYGYDGARLAVIYTALGAILPYADYGPRLGYGGAYWARGRELFLASRENERRAVIAANWAARSAAIARSRAAWIAGRERDADWRAYHAAEAGADAAYWQREEARRQADARRFVAWQHDDFHGAPPPRAIPAAWRDAHWARDRAAYAPVAEGPPARAPQDRVAARLPDAAAHGPIASPPPGEPRGAPAAGGAFHQPPGADAPREVAAHPAPPAGGHVHGDTPPAHDRPGGPAAEPPRRQSPAMQFRPGDAARPDRPAATDRHREGGRPTPAARAASERPPVEQRGVDVHAMPQPRGDAHPPSQPHVASPPPRTPPHASPPRPHAAPPPHAAEPRPAPAHGQHEHH